MFIGICLGKFMLEYQNILSVGVSMSASAAFSEVNCARPGQNGGYLSSGQCSSAFTSNNLDQDMDFESSHGPTLDGRNKPDLVAVGWQVCILCRVFVK